MHVWVVTVGEPLPRWSGSARPWRTGLLSQELARRNHQVTWWTSSVNHFTKELFVDATEKHALPDGRKIQFLHGKRYYRNVSLSRVLNHIEVAREFKRLAIVSDRPDIIWCSLPTIELSVAATEYGRANNVPVFIDVRDLWPDEIERRVPRLLHSVAKPVLASMKKSATKALGAADGITAISNKYLDWGLNIAGREQGPNDGVFPMAYPLPPHPAEVSKESVDRMLRAGVDPAKQIIWFAGSFVSSADLGTVIESARLLKDNGELQFVLTGAGEHELLWRRQAGDLKNVIFSGWVNSEELRWLAGVAGIALVAYMPGALQSLPNKLLEYLSFGVPVLLSLNGEARQLVEEHDVGLYYRAADPTDLRDQILRLVTRPELRERQAINARRLMRERYSVDVVYGALSDFLERRARRTES